MLALESARNSVTRLFVEGEELRAELSQKNAARGDILDREAHGEIDVGVLADVIKQIREINEQIRDNTEIREIHEKALQGLAKKLEAAEKAHKKFVADFFLAESKNRLKPFSDLYDIIYEGIACLNLANHGIPFDQLLRDLIFPGGFEKQPAPAGAGGNCGGI